MRNVITVGKAAPATGLLVVGLLLLPAHGFAALVNGIEWLDLAETGAGSGVTAPSYLDALTPALAVAGWGYASEAQVTGLYNTLLPNGTSSSYAEMRAFVNTMGLSRVDGWWQYSQAKYMTDAGVITSMGAKTNTFYLNTDQSSVRPPGHNTFAPDDISPYATYLVRPAQAVPVPAAAWLFGAALAGLGLVRRKTE